jgi:hypothetical protein
MARADLRPFEKLLRKRYRSITKLSPVEFLRSLDVEMTHPSAFEANSMAGIPVLSGHGPAEISTLVPAFSVPDLCHHLSHHKSEKFPGTKREHESD